MTNTFEYINEFNSDLDEVVNQIAKILALLDLELKKYNRFVLDLILREMLNNAVIHGNKNSSDHTIKLSIRIESAQFHIIVEDEGDGFGWQSIIHQQSNPVADHGRGFSIFQTYCTEIALNDKGNRISLKLDVNDGMADRK